MARQVALLLPVLAIVCLIEWMLFMSYGATYGVVLEIDVSIMSILICLPSVISCLATTIITINAAGQASHIAISWVSKRGSIRVIADRIVGIISQTASWMIWYRVVIAACSRMLCRVRIHKCCVAIVITCSCCYRLLLLDYHMARCWYYQRLLLHVYLSVWWWWVNVWGHGGVLESDVRQHHIHSYKFLICD